MIALQEITETLIQEAISQDSIVITKCKKSSLMSQQTHFIVRIGRNGLEDIKRGVTEGIPESTILLTEKGITRMQIGTKVMRIRDITKEEETLITAKEYTIEAHPHQSPIGMKEATET